jgi:hypothetical protein
MIIVTQNREGHKRYKDPLLQNENLFAEKRINIKQITLLLYDCKNDIYTI